MKKLGFVGFVCLLTLVFTSMTIMAPQKLFKSKGGKFTIMFKAKPAESSENVETAVGNIKMYMFMHEESGTKAYMVAYCDYPADIIKDADPYVLLNGSKGGVVEQFQAEISSEKESMFMGHPCIDFEAGGETYFTAYKLVLVKNRLYQVGILQNGEKVTAMDREAFIGSFKLIQ